MFTVPVIYIFFNRPEVTRRTFAILREMRPARLYLVADGARAGHPTDAANCEHARAVVEELLDWECEVTRDYSDVNLGCRDRVASGLNGAFQKYEEALVLEDDCLPDTSFFSFCEAMLDKYRDDPSVMHISGTNLGARYCGAAASYRFSHHPWIWGWATWRRAWSHYDFTMNTWDERLPALRSTFATAREAQFWIYAFNQARQDPAFANTWDYSWMYTCRSLKGKCILPTVNLVENLGFGAGSTHTGEQAAHNQLKAGHLSSIIHPKHNEVDRLQDELLTDSYRDIPVTMLTKMLAVARIIRWQKLGYGSRTT